MSLVFYTKSVHVKGDVTPIKPSVNHLAFCAIQNVMKACHVIIMDNNLILYLK